MIYGRIDKNGIWRTRFVMSSIHYDELDIVKVIKVGRLSWLGQLFRMQELDPCRKLTLNKPEGTRRVGKPRLRWLESKERGRKKLET